MKTIAALFLIFAVVHSQWTTTYSLAKARYAVAAISNGDYAYFAGGASAVTDNNIEIFDITTKDWVTTTHTLTAARTNVAAASSGDYVFFAGGMDVGGNPVSVMEVLKKSTNVMTTLQLSVSRQYPCAASFSDRILIAGDLSVSSVVDIFDTTTPSFTRTTATLPTKRTSMSSVVLGNKAYFAGGDDGAAFSKVVDVWDNTANSGAGGWDTTLTFPSNVARNEIAAVVVGNFVIFAGGYTDAIAGTPTDAVDIYDTANSQWLATTQLRRGLSGAIAGKYALFAGGIIDTSFTPSAIVDIWDSETKTWAASSSLQIARYYMASITLGNAAFFVSGLAAGDVDDAIDIYNLNQEVSTSGDPHFYGFQGQKYDVMGQPFEVYNIISAPTLQINSRFIPYYKTATQLLPTGTMMGEIGLKIHANQLYVNSNSTIATLNEMPVDLTKSWSMTMEDVTVSNVAKKRGYDITMATPFLSITFIHKVYLVTGLEPQTHFDYKAKLGNYNSELHGLLGQTWSSKKFADKTGAFYYLDGLEEDYRVKSSNIFGDDFTFNKYTYI